MRRQTVAIPLFYCFTSVKNLCENLPFVMSQEKRKNLKKGFDETISLTLSDIHAKITHVHHSDLKQTLLEICLVWCHKGPSFTISALFPKSQTITSSRELKPRSSRKHPRPELLNTLWAEQKRGRSLTTHMEKRAGQWEATGVVIWGSRDWEHRTPASHHLHPNMQHPHHHHHGPPL